MNINKIIILGNVMPKNNNKIHQRNWLYSIRGVCPTLTSTMFKDPPRILIEKKCQQIVNYGNYYGPDRGTSFAGNLYGIQGISPTITACIGHGGLGMIIIKG